MTQPMTVRDFMSAAVITFRPETPVLEAMHKLVENRIHGAPVLDVHGDLVGIVTERDCVRVTLDATYLGEGAGTIGEYMSRQVETVDPGTGIMDLAQMFVDRRFRAYPVIDDNRLVGIVSRRDVLRALLRHYRAY